jgi:threonine-phosphate decarboxylase
MLRHGGNIYEIERMLQIPAKQIVDFSANINPLGMPLALKSALWDNIDMLEHYPDIRYCALKEAIASVYGMTADLVFPGNGATELIYQYFRATRPARVLIVAPSFSEYGRAVRKAGGCADYFELYEKDNFTLSIPGLKMKLADNYDTLVICNPNNPTGNFLRLDQMEEIAAYAAKYETRMLVDESFIDFVNENPNASSVMLRSPQIFTIKSLTKFYAIPGLRLGFGIGINSDTNQKISSILEPWNINTLAAIAGCMVFDQKEFASASVRFMNEERIFLFEQLNEINGLIAYPSFANFILVKIDNGTKVQDLSDKLIQENLLIRSACGFGFLNSSFFRIAVKKREENLLLLESLRKHMKA